MKIINSRVSKVFLVSLILSLTSAVTLAKNKFYSAEVYKGVIEKDGRTCNSFGYCVGEYVLCSNNLQLIDAIYPQIVRIYGSDPHRLNKIENYDGLNSGNKVHTTVATDVVYPDPYGEASKEEMGEGFVVNINDCAKTGSDPVPENQVAAKVAELKSDGAGLQKAITDAYYAHLAAVDLYWKLHPAEKAARDAAMYRLTGYLTDQVWKDIKAQAIADCVKAAGNITWCYKQ